MTATRPSKILGVRNPWWAYQFDNALVFFGDSIEAAAQEMHNAGTKEDPRWQARYTLSQLLDRDFRLPREPAGDDIDWLKDADGMLYDEVG